MKADRRPQGRVYKATRVLVRRDGGKLSRRQSSDELKRSMPKGNASTGLLCCECLWPGGRSHTDVEGETLA